MTRRAGFRFEKKVGPSRERPQNPGPVRDKARSGVASPRIGLRNLRDGSQILIHRFEYQPLSRSGPLPERPGQDCTASPGHNARERAAQERIDVETRVEVNMCAHRHSRARLFVPAPIDHLPDDIRPQAKRSLGSSPQHISLCNTSRIERTVSVSGILLSEPTPS